MLENFKENDVSPALQFLVGCRLVKQEPVEGCYRFLIVEKEKIVGFIHSEAKPFTIGEYINVSIDYDKWVSFSPLMTAKIPIYIVINFVDGSNKEAAFIKITSDTPIEPIYKNGKIKIHIPISQFERI